MLDDEIDSRLRAVVSRVRLPIDDECRILVDRLIATAIERLQDSDDGDVTIAVEHLGRLFEDMTQQSRILRLDGLHVPLLIQALERLCPLWPFC